MCEQICTKLYEEEKNSDPLPWLWWPFLHHRCVPIIRVPIIFVFQLNNYLLSYRSGNCDQSILMHSQLNLSTSHLIRLNMKSMNTLWSKSSKKEIIIEIFWFQQLPTDVLNCISHSPTFVKVSSIPLLYHMSQCIFSSSLSTKKNLIDEHVQWSVRGISINEKQMFRCV